MNVMNEKLLLQKLRSLTDEERHQVACLIRRLLTQYRLRPVFFSLRAAAITFFILANMPTHAMSIFIAMGGGLSVALLIA
jgi:hypothetical protein